MKPHFVAKRITREGELIGYRLYQHGGLFGSLVFSRYFWLKP